MGTYFGEWKVNGSEIVVCGRGVLNCKNKLVLGYIKNGQWADGSP